MTLALRCDTCGVCTDEVETDVDYDGCSCCSSPIVSICGPNGWARLHGGKDECGACRDKREEEDRKRRAAELAVTNRWRAIMTGQVRFGSSDE